MAGLVGGTTPGITPKGFTLLSLTMAGPQGQAPARPIPVGPRPWGTLVASWPVPLACVEDPGFLGGCGWLIPPGCARPASPSRHALDVRADDSPNAADIAMETIKGCCWDDSCGDAAPAPAPTKR